MHIEMELFSDVRFKQRAVIEFLTAEKVPPNEIHRQMPAVYCDQCVDVSTVRRWVRRFKDGELGHADLSDNT
jgi:epoxyqueuosine reductase QueG